MTVKADGFDGSKSVKMSVRVEDTLKSYYQGPKYMHYGKRESEYVVIGRPVSAEIVR